MRQKLISWVGLIIYSFVFLYFPQISFASLYINEFSSDTSGTTSDPDWIELYNSSSSSVDLSEYKIEDLNGTNNKILTGTIGAFSFVTFDWTNKLNKTGDVISIIKINDLSLIDRVSYGDQGSDVASPSQNQSAGRNVDGGSNWIIFSASTKGLTNNTITPIPTSTPVPTATATPTSSPSPTRTPTPTKTPTPTPTTKPTSTPKPTPTSIPTPTPTIKVLTPTIDKITTQEKFDEKEDFGPTSILGEMVTASPSASPTTSLKGTRQASLFDFSKTAMGVGFVFVIGSGILAFRSYKKGKYDYEE